MDSNIDTAIEKSVSNTTEALNSDLKTEIPEVVSIMHPHMYLNAT